MPKRKRQTQINVTSSSIIDDITIPDPLSVEEIVEIKKGKGGRLNAFILYRMMLHRALEAPHRSRTMEEVSRLASIKWSNEDDDTKAKFKKRSDEVKKYYDKNHPRRFINIHPKIKDTSTLQSEAQDNSTLQSEVQEDNPTLQSHELSHTNTNENEANYIPPESSTITLQLTNSPIQDYNQVSQLSTDVETNQISTEHLPHPLQLFTNPEQSIETNPFIINMQALLERDQFIQILPEHEQLINHVVSYRDSLPPTEIVQIINTLTLSINHVNNSFAELRSRTILLFIRRFVLTGLYS